MHIAIKTADIGSIKAIVMVPADENFVFIRQVAEPVEKVNRFLFATYLQKSPECTTTSASGKSRSR